MRFDEMFFSGREVTCAVADAEAAAKGPVPDDEDESRTIEV